MSVQVCVCVCMSEQPYLTARVILHLCKGRQTAFPEPPLLPFLSTRCLPPLCRHGRHVPLALVGCPGEHQGSNAHGLHIKQRETHGLGNSWLHLRPALLLPPLAHPELLTYLLCFLALPQYVIPLLGMLLGNCTSSVSLGLGTVLDELTVRECLPFR